MQELLHGRARLGRALWVAMVCALSVRPSVGATQAPTDTYQITLVMETDTVTALERSGYSLFGFKAVEGLDRAGVPLVWFQTRQYSLRTVISWRAQYYAYTLLQDSGPSALIRASASYAISPGQVLEVQHRTGLGSVFQEGMPGTISIHNQTTAPMTTGLSQAQGNISSPICAFPLYGEGMQRLIPLEKVMLMFSTEPLAPGDAFRRSPDLAILIDLSTARSRTVRFDINQGWSWGGAAWAQKVPAGSDVVPWLILLR